MIETREQYERARNSAERFERSAAEFEALTKVPPLVDLPRLQREITALRTHAGTLRHELADYDARSRQWRHSVKDLALLAYTIVAGFVIGFVGEGLYAYVLVQEPLEHHLNAMLRRGMLGAVFGSVIGIVATVVFLRRRARGY